MLYYYVPMIGVIGLKIQRSENISRYIQMFNEADTDHIYYKLYERNKKGFFIGEEVQMHIARKLWMCVLLSMWMIRLLLLFLCYVHIIQLFAVVKIRSEKLEIHISLNNRRLLREYDSWKSKSQALNIFFIIANTQHLLKLSQQMCVSEVRKREKNRKNNKRYHQACMHTFTYRNYENPYTYHVARQIQYDKYRRND